MDPALRRVADMKPPAKIDGLLQFKKDVTKYFTLEEHAALWASSAGQVIQEALHRCEGHSRQWIDARQNFNELVDSIPVEERQARSQEMLGLRRDLIMKKMKYVDCLAYMTSKQKWSQYTTCWVQTVGNMTQTDFRRYKEQGGMEMICHTQRDALERDVGEMVSSAVQAGDSVAVEESNLFQVPFRSDEL